MDPNLIYVNGIDWETGKYAIDPVSVDALLQRIHVESGKNAATEQHGTEVTRFAATFGVDQTSLAEVGWGIVYCQNTPDAIHQALAPLIERRRQQAGPLFHELDYSNGEQLRDWYRRHDISAGNFRPKKVPLYLLLVGDPSEIPFEFQYLLDVEYAVGRVAFSTADEYHQYASSIVSYETNNAISNGKEIVYWGTRHPGDAATQLSSSLLIDPLANGIDDGTGTLDPPLHQVVGCSRTLLRAEGATRDALLDVLHAPHTSAANARRPPALLLTASHGVCVPAGNPKQSAYNGALLCQDWPGFGSPQPEKHFLSADEIDDDANVKGIVAFHFACYSAGTPDIDQFLTDPGNAGNTDPPARVPFVAALPQRLLSHPRGSALAVIGHVDRAWGFSIQPPRMKSSQIDYFHDCLCSVLRGCPLGMALSQCFGQRYSMLSVMLLTALSPTARREERLDDRDLVSAWLERNDAQNYVLLGDPAVRIRKDLLV